MAPWPARMEKITAASAWPSPSGLQPSRPPDRCRGLAGEDQCQGWR